MNGEMSCVGFLSRTLAFSGVTVNRAHLVLFFAIFTTVVGDVAIGT